MKKTSPKSCALLSGLIDYLAVIHQRPLNLLQVGGNDGISGDPVYESIIKHKINSIILEPEATAFSALQETYHGKKYCKLVNKAISLSTDELVLFRVAKSLQSEMDLKVKRNSLGVTSSNPLHVRRNILKHFPNLVENVDLYIEEFRVATETLDNLLVLADVSFFDIVQSDIEGQDLIFVNSILDYFSPECLPSIINFESLMTDEVFSQQLLIKLKKAGYRLYPHGADYLAFKV